MWHCLACACTMHFMRLPRHTVELTLAGIIILCLAWFFRQFKHRSAPDASPQTASPQMNMDTMKHATPVIDVPVYVERHENPVTASDTNSRVQSGGNWCSR